MRDISTRDEIFYEQHEERPLADMGNLVMQNTSVTHITASPMPRRSSRMARLSSRIMPSYAATSATGLDRVGHEEERPLRRRVSNTDPSSTSIGAGDHGRRLSLFGSLVPSPFIPSRSRRPRELATISSPFPLTLDGSLPPSGFARSSLRDALPSRALSEEAGSSPSRQFSVSRGARLSRIRRSISTSLEGFFRTQNAPNSDHGHQLSSQRPSRLTPIISPNFLVPPLDIADPNIDLGNAGLERSSRNGEQMMSDIAPLSDPLEHASSRIEPTNWTERWIERGSGGRRGVRRMSSMLRGRSSRLIRRDNDGPLPRILHLAATAIAAQLSGTSEQPVQDMHAIIPDDIDGSLDNIFRTLQSATGQAGEALSNNSPQFSTRPLGTLPPLNFLRVFRFVSQSSTTVSSNAAPNAERMGGRITADTQSAIDGNASINPEGRTVTLVVVGVRSVPSENIGREDTAVRDPQLESLLNFSSSASTNALRHGAGGPLSHRNSRSRLSRRRRASVGSLNIFPANGDVQQRHHTLSRSRQGFADISFNPVAATPLAFLESPPGPHPPPSTPADSGLSAYSSAAPTPSRQPSFASAIQQPPRLSRDLAAQHLREAEISEPEDHTTHVQHRRRSDSEFARHRDLGAGAARRNGVVEPDVVDTGDNPASGSRSWLIYVVGTNLSEDHPALTTPSLFTDVCYIPRLHSPFCLVELISNISESNL